MVKLNELLLDTNFILECTKRRLLDRAKELVPGAEVVTLRAVMQELEKQDRKLAIELVAAERIAIRNVTGYADKAIEEYAEQGGVAVATNDRELKEKLRAKKIPIVFPTKNGCGIVGGII